MAAMPVMRLAPKSTGTRSTGWWLSAARTRLRLVIWDEGVGLEGMGGVGK